MPSCIQHQCLYTHTHAVSKFDTWRGSSASSMHVCVEHCLQAPAGEPLLLRLDLHHGAGHDVVAQLELASPLQVALMALEVVLAEGCQSCLHRL